jgi:hypothetical protein
LQISRKQPYFCVDAFPSFSGDLLGLLHQNGSFYVHIAAKTGTEHRRAPVVLV